MNTRAGWSWAMFVLFISTITACGGGGKGGPGGVNNPCFTAKGCTTDKACAVDADCDDHEPCTEDRCDTAIAACHYSGLDQDDDGYVVDNCGGDDCDDSPDGSGSFSHPGLPETCDGQDNDCDGDADEEKDLMPKPCGQDVGECQTGVKKCINGYWSTEQCIGEIIPMPEICDGKDNDCDGETDEQIDQDNDGAWAQCGDIEYLGRDCDDTDPSRPSKEVCDGIDNDCNNIIDVCDLAGCWRFSLESPQGVSVVQITLMQTSTCLPTLTGNLDNGTGMAYVCEGEMTDESRFILDCDISGWYGALYSFHDAYFSPLCANTNAYCACFMGEYSHEDASYQPFAAEKNCE